ncbi:hypothetical protein ACFVZX_29345, partial [Streptomyces erythrochromogenes]
WKRGGSGRRAARLLSVRWLRAGGAPAPGGAPPAIPESGQLPLLLRPSLQAVGRTEPNDVTGTRTVDLTAEDDTQTIPRLDSLERKLKDLEQQFG